ncbi:hypothetical protein A3Q35_02330 [Aeribacillus pallidus]|nr:hypothetical protein A3Q35_02330 [Aeribacillus pallidus]
MSGFFFENSKFILHFKNERFYFLLSKRAVYLLKNIWRLYICGFKRIKKDFAEKVMVNGRMPLKKLVV